jgi:tRNA (cmo5U34)-methyltransferase
VGQYHWDPATYLALMRAEIPDYERLQDEAVAATGAGAGSVLELGTGTGETARRLLERHPGARLVGLDSSPEMLARARASLAGDRVELRLARLDERLPDGPFDVVISALTVHHLGAAGKAELFARVARVLGQGGLFVLADVVVPDDPADAITPIDPGYDTPSSVPEQLCWLRDAGLEATVVWSRRDLAVIVATRPAEAGA